MFTFTECRRCNFLKRLLKRDLDINVIVSKCFADLFLLLEKCAKLQRRSSMGVKKTLLLCYRTPCTVPWIFAGKEMNYVDLSQ